MWKRRQQPRGPGRPSSGIEEIIREGNISAPSQSNTQPPPRPPRPDKDELPPLPFELAQGPPPASQNRTKRRPVSTVSSVYSQPTPNLAAGQFPRINTQIAGHTYVQDVEISPPSSPETNITIPRYVPSYQERPASPDISPVDETTTALQVQITRPESRPAASNIPVLRREKRHNQLSAAAAKVNVQSEMGYGGDAQTPPRNARWNNVAGEPTTSSTWRPQVQPGFYNVPGNNDTGISQGVRPLIASRGHASFGDRIRKLKEGPLMQSSRAEWKGPSGRSNPVEPFFDQLHVRPLQIPQKSGKSVNSPPNSGSNSPYEAGTPFVSPATHGRAGLTLQTIQPTDSGRNNTDITTSPTTYNVISPKYPSSKMVRRHSSAKPLSQNPVTPTYAQRRRSPPYTTVASPAKIEKDTSVSTIERNLHEALKDINVQTPQRNEPGSRFSVTTYATTTADSSPRMSSESPPPVPVHQPAISPIINRRHPNASSSFDSARATTRKAVGDPGFLGVTDTSVSTRRNSKALPKSPEEEQSVDLISSLQARLDSLARQRDNIKRSIFQMTELMPHDSIGMGRGMEALRQQEEKRQVELLREDLADIMREEHELGLKLHRAWKRKDQQAIYEPTTLWVRRITG